MGDILSLGDLRKLTGKPAHVINYAITCHGPEPFGRIGIMRVWRADDLPRIRAAIDKTSARHKPSCTEAALA